MVLFSISVYGIWKNTIVHVSSTNQPRVVHGVISVPDLTGDVIRWC